MKGDLYYYVERQSGALCVYGDCFIGYFRRFNADEKSWEKVGITYSQFLHDYDVTNISAEKADEITGGNLPVKDFEKFRKEIKELYGVD